MIEELVAREAMTLLRRDFSKYKWNIVGMYALSAYDMDLGSTFRSGYFFVRHIDDVLDGDRFVSDDPLAYVQDLRFQVETGSYKKGSIALLAEHAISGLEKRKKPSDDPTADFLRSFDGIVFDFERAQSKRVLTTDQLDHYYWVAFDPVVNLALMGLTPDLRSKDIPIISYGQGRVYSIRDLNTDWARGLINVPAEVLQKANLTQSALATDVQTSSQVQDWFEQTLSATRPELIEAQTRLQNFENKATNLIMGGIIKKMLSFIDSKP